MGHWFFHFTEKLMSFFTVMQDYEEAIKSYENYIERNGVDDKVAEAFKIVAVDVLENRHIKEDGLKIARKAKDVLNIFIPQKTGGMAFWDLEEYGKAHDEIYPATEWAYELFRAEAPYSFESYMFYMEKNRKPEKRFYKPRRGTLKIAVDDLQSLEDDKYDVYGLSLPSRTGKTTLCAFFLTWVGYRKPNSHSAMGGHSGQLAKRFFKGYSHFVEEPEYTFDELFQILHPNIKTIESKSSDPAEFTINLGEPDDFSTISARGIDGTWTGAIDISGGTDYGYLYVDDLVRDREHSMSPSRMENTYQEYQNKMLDRMNDGAKKVLVGTLWSTIDPLMREEKLNEDNPRALFRKIPALNENGESNFQYEEKGFSTEYYINMRDRLDPAEWMAKFQQAPFVREGLCFPIEKLRFFDGTLPVGKCRTIGIVDAAFGGGDSLSMPICKDFGEEQRYIVGWVHDKRSPEYTVGRVVDAIERYMITFMWFEKNSGGQLLAEKVKNEMQARGVVCKIELYSAPVRMHKEEKITGYSDEVLRQFLFLMPKAKKIDIEDGEIYFADDDYRKAIDEMTTWSAEGKKQHDDAPDVIASLAMKLSNRNEVGKMTVVHNPLWKRR